MSDARFDHAQLTRCDYSRTRLPRTSFHNVAVDDSKFRGADRRGQRGTNAALLRVEAPSLDLEDLPCIP